MPPPIGVNMRVVNGIVGARASRLRSPSSREAPAKMRLPWQQVRFKYSTFYPPGAGDGWLLVPTCDGLVAVYESN
jgi:hypothetical protein